MTRARELLATTDLPIQQVASEVGFHDPHYFGRVFRKHVGASPRAFPEAHRNDPANDPPPLA